MYICINASEKFELYKNDSAENWYMDTRKFEFSMNYHVAAISLVGKVRRKNEDNFCIDTENLPMLHGNTPIHKQVMSNRVPHIVGVFDGMGGHSEGEKASYYASSSICSTSARPEKGKSYGQLLADCCIEANKEVCEKADGYTMGTTCALLCLHGKDYITCNVGDSPIFLVRDGRMKQLSMDHNERSLYEKITGRPAPQEQKFRLTQYLGIPEEEMMIEPFVTAGRLQHKDIMLLCSDGLTDMLAKDEILEIINASETAECAVSALSERAMQAGGKDNITIICVKAENKPVFTVKLLNNIYITVNKKKKS